MTTREFTDDILASLSCDGCPFDGAGMPKVGMDSWNSMAEQCDILFMGLNPGVEEAKRGLPFVGKSGIFLRDCMAEAGIGRWAIVNSILCSTRNEAEIPDVGACRRACRMNAGRFCMRIRPKAIVPCGNGASGLFGLAGGITANSRRTFVSRGPGGKARPTLVLPIIHPSSLIRNGGKSAANYRAFVDRLREIGDLAARFDPDTEGFGIGPHSLLFRSS